MTRTHEGSAVIRNQKKRYIGFYIASRARLTKRQLLSLFFHELQMNPRPRIRIIEYHALTGVGILLCYHTHLPQLRQVFQQLSETSDKSQLIRLLGVSGTIKTLRRKFLNVKHTPFV
jgi:RNase P/RNase MRP subunit POP5